MIMIMYRGIKCVLVSIYIASCILYIQSNYIYFCAAWFKHEAFTGVVITEIWSMKPNVAVASFGKFLMISVLSAA